MIYMIWNINDIDLNFKEYKNRINWQDSFQTRHVKRRKRAVSRHIGRVPGPSLVTKQEACWLDRFKVPTSKADMAFIYHNIFMILCRIFKYILQFLCEYSFLSKSYSGRVWWKFKLSNFWYNLKNLNFYLFSFFYSKSIRMLDSVVDNLVQVNICIVDEFPFC